MNQIKNLELSADNDEISRNNIHNNTENNGSDDLLNINQNNNDSKEEIIQGFIIN